MVTPTNQPGEYRAIRGRDLQKKKETRKTERQTGSFSQSKRAAIKLCSSIQSKRCPATSIARAWNWKPKREIIMYNFSYNFVQSCTILRTILCNLVKFCTFLCNLAPTNIWHHKDRCNFAGAKNQFFLWHCQHLLHLVLSQINERCSSNSHFRRTREAKCCR